MSNKKYDIFISYRRDGGAQYARILQLMLSQRGYNVFLDYDELRDGNFNEKIQKAIQEAPVFMIILSEKSMKRCVNEGDWVRREILMAVEEGKHIIPINPDNTFDGIPEEAPIEIKNAIGQNQHSEINFGQALGVMVDMMINERLVPDIGKRTKTDNVDIEYDSAKETLKKIDNHNRFMRRLGITGLVIAIAIVLSTCLYFWHHWKHSEENKKEQELLANIRSDLERKYNCFSPYLNPDLTQKQMEALEDILSKMVPVKPDTLWMSQFEFTVGQWYGIKGEAYDESKKDFPMTNISYGEIWEIVMDLNEMTNIKFCIPSVEQWEYAAHSGRYHDTLLYSGSDSVDKVAWYKGNSDGKTHPSNGQQGKNPNKLDLYDMSGNVGEVCNTPFVTETGETHYSVCGGNYASDSSQVTITSKAGIDPNKKDEATGFRLMIDKQQL